MNLSGIEKFWISIMRRNAEEKKQEIRKEWQVWRLRVRFTWKSKDCIWGRFGGGWNWKLGIMVGATTVIMSILIFDLRFSWIKKEDKK